MSSVAIRVFFPDNQADGLRVITKDNWSGTMTICPRDLVSSYRDRKDFGLPGIYFLCGSGMVYIGEGDPIGPRIDYHLSKKEFWSRVCCFTSHQINKAHIQHLEARAITLAKETGIRTLTNDKRMELPSLSEADVSMVERFLEEVIFLLKSQDMYLLEKPRTEPVVTELPKIEQPPEYKPEMANTVARSPLSVIPDRTRTEYTKPQLVNTSSPPVYIPTKQKTQRAEMPKFGNT